MVKGTKKTTKKSPARQPRTLQEITGIPVSDQVHGAIETGEKKTLYEILGKTASLPYRQNNVEEYEAYLNSLNVIQIEEHAQKLGIVPTRDRPVLIRRLVKVFRQEIVNFNASHQPEIKLRPLSKAAKRILSGR